VRRTLEVMNEIGSDDPETVRRAGAVDLPTLQRYLNFWFSSSLDLFGADSSSNAAAYFATGIKGRPDEKKFADHIAAATSFDLEIPDGTLGTRIETIPLRNAMNEVVRNAYVDDCMKGLTHWNRILEAAGHAYRFTLPSTRFRRGNGSWAAVPTDPAGNRITQEAYDAQVASWLPSADDRAFVASLMQRVTEPGKIAGWIAPPDKGGKDRPVDYEYVRLA
jgi:benzoyl-CoA 2,3-dioxygenase component B